DGDALRERGRVRVDERPCPAAAAHRRSAPSRRPRVGAADRPGPPPGHVAAPVASSNGAGSEGGLPLVVTRPIFGDATAHRSPALAAVRTYEELVLHP